MPIPVPKKDEENNAFVARCMGNETMKKDYPDNGQRIAICLGQTKRKSKGNLLDQVLEVLGFNMTYNCESCDDTEGEELTVSNLVIPKEEDYIDAGEQTEECDISHIVASEYQGRKVTLNKYFRTPDGPKKFSVYVKNEKGNVVKVNFGDPNMTIKKDIPARRKSFRARMRCDNPGPKWKSRYWACKSW
jgi:hypothetical protein